MTLDDYSHPNVVGRTATAHGELTTGCDLRARNFRSHPRRWCYETFHLAFVYPWLGLWCRRGAPKLAGSARFDRVLNCNLFVQQNQWRETVKPKSSLERPCLRSQVSAVGPHRCTSSGHSWEATQPFQGYYHLEKRLYLKPWKVPPHIVALFLETIGSTLLAP